VADRVSSSFYLLLDVQRRRERRDNDLSVTRYYSISIRRSFAIPLRNTPRFSNTLRPIPSRLHNEYENIDFQIRKFHDFDKYAIQRSSCSPVLSANL